MDAANLGFGIWAAMWLALVAVIAYRGRHGDRPRAAGWMITIAAFLAALEDPSLLAWLASVTPRVDPDGVLGLVHSHVRGHMYGGAVFSLAGLVVCVWVARTALRAGERWAWNALLVYLLMVAAVDVVEVLFIYPHGFPFGVTPPDEARGFGWAQIGAWITIWGFALWYSRRHLRRGGPPKQPG